MKRQLKNTLEDTGGRPYEVGQGRAPLTGGAAAQPPPPIRCNLANPASIKFED